jgi:hypothetical protein
VSSRRPIWASSGQFIVQASLVPGIVGLLLETARWGSVRVSARGTESTHWIALRRRGAADARGPGHRQERRSRVDPHP